VFQKLANVANPAVAQVIDVVHRADVLAQLQQVPDGAVKIVWIKRTLIKTGRILIFEQLDVEFQTPDAGEVVLAGIEEHAMKQGCRRVQRRRITGPQLAVNLVYDFLWSLHEIAAPRLDDHE